MLATCYGCRHLAGKLETDRSGVHVCVRTYPHQEVGRWGPEIHEDPRRLEPDCYTGGYRVRLPDNPIEPIVKRKPAGIDPERVARIRERLRRASKPRS